MRFVGHLSLVLHAHLPFVRHPEYPDFLEEDWFYEAVVECYVPLLLAMERLSRDGVPFRLTLSLTPPLCELLADPLLQDRCLLRLHRLVDLAQREAKLQRRTPFAEAAQDAASTLVEVLDYYEDRCRRDLLAAFRRFADDGSLCLITCSATHAMLPLCATDESRRAQIEMGARVYARHLGRRPVGMWLPECAYAPGLDSVVAQSGIRFFFLETHGLTRGLPPARLGPSRPVVAPADVAVFARDPECSQQVWSSEQGYPGDPWYREFYRDLGYDLPYDRVKRTLHSDGVRRNIGVKYHRITGKVPLGNKEPYVPSIAQIRAAEHAAHFMANRHAQAKHLLSTLGVPPHTVAPYDAELFGHWWYEGPLFLEHVFRVAHRFYKDLRLLTPEQYLELETTHQRIVPALSSWGANGYFQVWVNKTNQWIYPYLHQCEERMVSLAQRFVNPTPMQQRALNQAARELMLAQSSDWAFIMNSGTMVEYAERRTREHVHRFQTLADGLDQNHVDPVFLSELEWKDSLFPDMDYRLYHPGEVRHRGAGSAVITGEWRM